MTFTVTAQHSWFSINHLLRSPRCVCRAVLFCAVAGLPRNALADDHPRVVIYGAGASSCSEWRAERNKIESGADPTPLAWEQMGWILGYATAVSQHVQQPPGAAMLPGGATLALMLDAYCTQRPSDILAVAMLQVTEYSINKAKAGSGRSVRE